MVLSFVISVYLIALFLIPLIKIIRANAELKDSTPNPNYYNRISWTILLTSTTALISTSFFNGTLSTPIGDYAPLVSALDLMVNHAMMILPYLMSKLYEEHAEVSPDSSKIRGSVVAKSDLEA